MPRIRSIIPQLCAASLASLLAITPGMAAEKPVKVYILSGQSNMVGIGHVSGSSLRWGKEFSDAVLSVYAGNPDAAVDYDKMKPEKTVPLASFGGVEPESYPKEGVSVVRGYIEMPETGIYEFRAGYEAGEENIMTVDGTEVHHKLPGGVAVKPPIKLEASKKVPFKITHLNHQAHEITHFLKTP